MQNQQEVEFQHQADQVKSKLEAIKDNINKVEPLSHSKPPVTTDFDTKIAQYEAEMTEGAGGNRQLRPGWRR